MSKRKWRKIKPVELADAERQKEILGLIDQANGAQGPPGGGCLDCEHCDCGKRGAETAQVER